MAAVLGPDTRSDEEIQYEKETEEMACEIVEKVMLRDGTSEHHRQL